MSTVGAGTATRRAGMLLVALLTSLVAMAAFARPAGAADGYTIESSALYRFDPAIPALDVTVTYRMTNTRADRNLGGGRYESYYFNGITVPLDSPTDGLTDLVVTVDGRPAETVQSDETGFTVLDVDFPFRLRYRRTATVVVSYRLLGAPPRTEDSLVRVNPAYVSTPIFAFADDGAADVRVEVPDGWEVDSVGDDADRSVSENGVSVTEFTDIAEPLDFGVLFTARLDDALDSTPLQVGDARFEVRAWPGDTAWKEFAELHVTRGVPALERLVGTPWPETNETDVIEASTPYLRGYAGFYYAASDVIEVGEELDSHTVLHELSHAWFNDAAIAERWISEGLADEIGARAVAELGEPLPSPADYEPPDDADPVEPFPLNEWDASAGNALDDATEYFGYHASFEVMRALGDEIGEERMSDLLSAVLGGQRAYSHEADSELTPARDPDPVDWREFLDLAEQVGLSTDLERLYRERVVADDDLGELDRRDDVLGSYADLEQRGGTWAPPEAVRRAMADWQWFGAEGAIEQSNAALDDRDELAEVLSPLGLSPSASIESAYQDASDLTEFATVLDGETAAAERLADSRSSLAEQLGRAGFDVPALTQDRYDAEPLAIADETEAQARRAADVLDVQGTITAALEQHELAVPGLPPDAFVSSPDDLLATLDRQREAAEAVDAAFDADADAGSIVERLGGVGSDADTQLATARDALASGDTETAVAAAQEATATLGTFDERGTARLVAVALGLVVGLALVLATNRHRRRDREPTTPHGR